jgi:hypothetical protein
MLKKLDNTDIFIIFILAFLVFYLMSIRGDRYTIFFLGALIVVMIYYFYMRLQNDEKMPNLQQTIETMETTFSQGASKDFEIPNDKVYFIHKRPRNLKNIKRTADIRNILLELKALEVYDMGLYDRIVTYTEYFLNVHYKIMLGKYDFELYFPILKDIRKELLNLLKSYCHNIPRVSKIRDIENIDVFLEKQTSLMQAKTYKYIKIAHHKYAKMQSHSVYKAPFESDPRDDILYNVF